MTDASGDSFRWDDIDQRLLSPKTNGLAAEMHTRVADEERKIDFEVSQSGNAGAYLPRLFDFHEALASEWVERLYAIHCEVWGQQNERISSAFIRAVRDRSILTTLAARKSSVKSQLAMRGVRISKPANPVAVDEWGRRMDRLSAAWASKLEAEAVSLEYRDTPATTATSAPDNVATPMAAAVLVPPQWERITPEELIPAIKRIRESFDRSSWKCSTITKKYCYGVLHPQEIDPSSLDPYTNAFETYRVMIGSAADKQFTDLCRVGTPPALFKAFFEAFRKGMEIEIQTEFDEVLEIGHSNAEMLKTHPVEWAKLHLQFLIRAERESTKRWIKEVCDKQGGLSGQLTHAEVDELILWKTWRAPRLLHMQPSGNTSYDPATEWTREDEARSETLLDSFSRRFIRLLEIDLDRIVGDAYVRLAQNGEIFKVQQQQQPPRPQSPAPIQPHNPESREPVEQKQGMLEPGDTAITWEEIEITFLSDHRIQIRAGKNTGSLNYADFGFQDGRNGTPNRAWVVLRILAEQRGMIRQAAQTGTAWSKVEKRIQEIRRMLRRHFGISGDPIPFLEGAGYRARFKISCGPSYTT